MRTSRTRVRGRSITAIRASSGTQNCATVGGASSAPCTHAADNRSMMSDRGARRDGDHRPERREVGLVDRCPAVVDREELAVESRGAEFGEREVIGAEHRGKPGHEVMVRHRAVPRTP